MVVVNAGGRYAWVEHDVCVCMCTYVCVCVCVRGWSTKVSTKLHTRRVGAHGWNIEVNTNVYQHILFLKI